MRHFTFVACVSLCLALFGCASTKVNISGIATRPLCQTGGEQLTALVLWGPAWLRDHKDAALREAAAQRGIERFFAQAACFSKVEIRRLADGESFPFDEEIVALAASNQPPHDRVVVIAVRELGPIVRLPGSPAPAEGGTEVVLEVRVLVVRTGISMAHLRTHLQNRGAFGVKSVTTLEQDTTAALQATLAPTASPQ